MPQNKEQHKDVLSFSGLDIPPEAPLESYPQEPGTAPTVGFSCHSIRLVL